MVLQVFLRMMYNHSDIISMRGKACVAQAMVVNRVASFIRARIPGFLDNASIFISVGVTAGFYVHGSGVVAVSVSNKQGGCYFTPSAGIGFTANAEAHVGIGVLCKAEDLDGVFVSTTLESSMTAGIGGRYFIYPYTGVELYFSTGIGFEASSEVGYTIPWNKFTLTILKKHEEEHKRVEELKEQLRREDDDETNEE
mmetsp:Transcript_28260/g.31395  ORF Transcript_28260/g.31395 Transcript_28260/m.31395 type:complete len:197 (+) Transcript_28260:90-680(+)